MKIAILGASGLVGRTMVQLLEKATWVQVDPLLLVSSRSAGTSIPFRGRELLCQEVSESSFQGVDVALFSAGGDPSCKWAPIAVESGCLVVDNSSAFRMDEAVPLVVPEINGDLIAKISQGGGIIANPNCSTIQIVMALAPLARMAKLESVQVTTMQAVSGAGQDALAELNDQLKGSSDNPQPSQFFPRILAGNVIPAIGSPTENGGFEEETKVENEMRKILGRDQGLAVTCTATRVPVANGHSAAIRAVFETPLSCAAAALALGQWPGLEVTSDPHDFKTAREISGCHLVHVGRLRPDPNTDRALLMWVVADNLLKGAAWNAVQIAQMAASGEQA